MATLSFGSFEDYLLSPARAYTVAEALLSSFRWNPKMQCVRGLSRRDAKWHVEHACRALMIVMQHAGLDPSMLRQALDAAAWDTAKHHLEDLAYAYNELLNRHNFEGQQT